MSSFIRRLSQCGISAANGELNPFIGSGEINLSTYSKPARMISPLATLLINAFINQTEQHRFGFMYPALNLLITVKEIFNIRLATPSVLGSTLSCLKTSRLVACTPSTMSGRCGCRGYDYQHGRASHWASMIAQ